MTPPVVKTTAGSVSGVAEDGYERYLGIPYARPPVGPLRFAAPQPVQPWTGVLAAERFGPHAPQVVGLMEQFLGGGSRVVVDEAESLRLNVWTPRADDSARPVMVWIHGGGFTIGTSATPWYDGRHFARDHDMVMVSLNYRLGVTGFTYLGDIGGPELRGSGSLGVQDAIAALEWVRDNIAAFGGDPGNVTVFGESAGAMSVGTLLGMPGARGLFHRAILQSGAANNVHNSAVAAELTTELLSILGITEGDPVRALRELPVETLLEAHQTLTANRRQDGLVSQPVIDGLVVDRPPLEAVAAGSAAGVPLLIGTNADEWKLFSLIDPQSRSLDEDGLLARIRRVGVADPHAMVATYRRRLSDASPAAIFDAFMTDSAFRIPAIRLAEAQHAAGGNAWMYFFKWATPQFGGALGSCHALEIPFVFNAFDRAGSKQFTGEDVPTQLAEDMNATWAAFARHGDPSKGRFGDWPRYEPKTRSTMILDVGHELVDDPLADERRAWLG